MVNIKIDREMLIQELYELRSVIPHEDSEDAKKKLMEIVMLVQNAPVDESKANFPRIIARRG